MPQIAGYPLPLKQIEDFCRKYGVAEFSLFGSILRDDFRPESDVDVLVSLEAGRTMTPESYLDMRDELSAMFGEREIDLVQKRLLTNPFRRQEILATRHILAHDYDEVDNDIVWRIVTDHVPVLIEQLKPLIPPQPPIEE